MFRVISNSSESSRENGSSKSSSMASTLTRIIALISLISIQTGCEQALDSGNPYLDTVNTDMSVSLTHITRALSTAADSLGNYYITGETYSINSESGDYFESPKCFVNKYTSSGASVYQHVLNSTGGCKGATDTQDNLFIVYNNSDIYSETNPGFTVLKYNAQGIEQFKHQFTLSPNANWYADESRATAITADGDGNVYIAGAAKEGLDGNVQSGSTDVFIVKYNASGEKVFTKQLGIMDGFSWPTALVSDVNGNIYIVGITNGALDGVPSSGYQDMFLIKYDANGNLLYVHDTGASTTYTYANAITIDPYGNIYIAGSIMGGSLDGNTATGWRDAIVCKFDPAGNKIYTRQFGAADSFAIAKAATTDSLGNLFVSGYSSGSITGSALTGYYDAFLVKYSSDGLKLNSIQDGYDQAQTIPTSLALLPNDNVIVAGSTHNYDTALYVRRYDNNGATLQ